MRRLREAVARQRYVTARAVMVFFVAFFGLCLLAGGKRLVAPSADNHFTHLAQGWLDGRLHHQGKPPGYCTDAKRRARQCSHHSYDDWAVVYTLALDDGSVIRGYPCRTSACALATRTRGGSSWIVPGRAQPLEIARGRIRSKADTWYVSFPPGPALVWLPFVAFFGLRLWDVLLTCMFAAAIPVVLVHLLDRERGVEDGRGAEHLWAAAAWTFASPACFVGAHGRVWFTAQILSALFTCLYLSNAWKARRPALAGICLGMAIACRPFMLLALPFFLFEWWREGRRTAAALHFLVPLALIGAVLALHNFVRFEDPLEFGHRYLDIRWQQRMQEVGMFSTTYLGRNLRCLFTLLPQLGESMPYLKVSVHGSALWLGSPWLATAFAARKRHPQRVGLLVCLVLVALPALFYQNSGQLQFAYRFALDWLLFALLCLICGGAASGRLRRRVFAGTVVVAMLFHLYGAWQFGRHPGQLFVSQPPLWPFGDELERAH